MKSHKHDEIFVATIGMVSLTILIGAFLISNKVNADDSFVSTATITVPVSCSMIGITNTAHTAEIPNGIDSRGSDYYPNGIGQTTLKAYCNDNEGFSIYAVGYTGDTIGNTYLRDANLGQTDDIQTGTTFSGNSSNWAMKIGVTSGTYTPIIAGSTADTERQSGDTDYSGWVVIPSTYERVAYRNSGTDVDNDNIQAEGANVTTTYAAYISPIQKAGTYVGKVKYTLVHPANEEPLQPVDCPSGKICYNPNGGNVVGVMGQPTISSSDTSATLLASNFSREGYGFAGWSTTYDYSEPTGFLGPNEDISFTAGQYTGTNPGLSLYAHWVRSAGSLQTWTGCPSLAQGSVTALTDLRDNDTYAVAKLADGNCWMIENLRLDNTAAHNSDGSLAQGYGTSETYGNFSGLAEPEFDNFDDVTVANSLYYSGTQTGTATVNIGASDSSYRFPRYNNTNTASRSESPIVAGVPTYNYGNYYSWPAAAADTNDIVHYFYSTSTSICPKQWRLPTGGFAETYNINVGHNLNTFSDYYRLGYDIMGSNITANESNNDGYSGYAYYDTTTTNPDGDLATEAFRKYPNNFLFAGAIAESEISDRGGIGYYWTSTYAFSDYGLFLYLSDSAVYPGTHGTGKYYGVSVRCMAAS